MRFVTRAEWGASPPRSVTTLPKGAVEVLVYHYSAAGVDEEADHANCAKRVRGIQNFHMGPARGWNDIAYNFLTCKHGYVFEGRGWDTRSAATGPTNDRSIASCFLGDDTKNRDDVTAAGRQAMVDVGHAATTRYGKLRYAGHRDFMVTSCPGDEIYEFVHSDKFRELVERAAAPKLWPIPIPSWFWSWATWRLEGKKTMRPAVAPARVPDWAWRRLNALVKNRHGPAP